MASKVVLIVGGGFFGSFVACDLVGRGFKVLLVEAADQLLTRASYHNQARVHNGYHYPRSLLTGLRSRVNFPRFVSDYRPCIDQSFDKYYAVSAIHSKVNASQFKRFCETIGAPVSAAPPEVEALFDKRLIERVFKVQEYAFDASILRDRMAEELEKGGTEVLMGTTCARVEDDGQGRVRATLQNQPDGTFEVVCDYVFNCTYSGINTLLKASELTPLPLKHEFTEMALIDLPTPLKTLGVTVMCGPFFSFMPFPARRLHSLSHVRYTPHRYWRDDCPELNNAELYHSNPRQSNFELMIRDASRFVPMLAEAKQLDSLWEIKTVLPQSEQDDSRPILFHRHPQLPNLISVMGGKIDNVFELSQELECFA